MTEHKTAPAQPQARPLTTDDEDRLISKMNQIQSASLDRDEAISATTKLLVERLDDLKSAALKNAEAIAGALEVASKNTEAIGVIRAELDEAFKAVVRIKNRVDSVDRRAASKAGYVPTLGD